MNFQRTPYCDIKEEIESSTQKFYVGMDLLMRKYDSLHNDQFKMLSFQS